MKESKRIEILSKYLPEDYLGAYLYVLYDDPYYLPDDCMREDKNSKSSVDKLAVNEKMKDLVILMGRAILDREVDDE